MRIRAARNPPRPPGPQQGHQTPRGREWLGTEMWARLEKDRVLAFSGGLSYEHQPVTPTH